MDEPSHSAEATENGETAIEKQEENAKQNADIVDATETVLQADITTEKISEETKQNINDALDRIPALAQLTLKNLDTGEEFIIGENDPDFDFDTFEIRDGADIKPIVEERKIKDEDEPEVKATNVVNNTTQSPRKRFWNFPLLNYLFGSRKKGENVEQASESPETSNKPKPPFTKLSSFKFRRELGKGAFGRVLLAEAKNDGKFYALKIISKKNMRSSDRRQAKAERDILYAMTLTAPHPFTSGLKFAFQSVNNLYLGMDFIPGGNLRELIRKFKHLPEDWVRFYAAELVLAISHLHSLNVLYRDIKPHNVMVDARGHVILIDFGLSKQEIYHPRGALSLVGTPDYSAPEVLKTGVQQIEQHNREKANATKKGHKKPSSPSVNPKIGYGKAADWWSLGIMIYEMLGGTPTFRGADLRQTYQRILYADLEFVPEERFSINARILLTGLIKRDPTLRLGAFDNPPKDIMSQAFFEGIDWDKLYNRVTDGPFIPEAIPMGSSKKHANNGGKNEKATGNKIKEPVRKNSVDNNRRKSEENRKNSEEEEDDESELLSLRDSVFVTGGGKGKGVADWSFIDENVLMSASKKENDPNPDRGFKNEIETREAQTEIKTENESQMKTAAVEVKMNATLKTENKNKNETKMKTPEMAPADAPEVKEVLSTEAETEKVAEEKEIIPGDIQLNIPAEDNNPVLNPDFVDTPGTIVTDNETVETVVTETTVNTEDS